MKTREQRIMDHVKAINGELAQKLEIYKDIWHYKSSAEVILEEEERISLLYRSGIVQRAIGVGGQSPDFTLWNAEHKQVALSSLLAKGPVVLCWYQGGWNPYCNIQLRYLQSRLDDFTAAGGTLVALSPELPDRFLTTKERIQLKFEVLVDFNNQVARQFGITFIESDLRARQHRLLLVNGVATQELPLAATYVLDTDARVRYAFADPDFRRRAEPDEVLQVLYDLKQGQGA